MGKKEGPPAPQMTKTQAEFCKKITKKIYDIPIAKYFRNPVDKTEVKDYNVKKPIDLGTVLTKLESEQYKSADQWKSDMKLIWDNAKEFNKQGTPLHQIASELKMYFERKIELIPKTEMSAWEYKVKRQHQKVLDILAVKPRPNKAKIILKKPTFN